MRSCNLYGIFTLLFVLISNSLHAQNLEDPTENLQAVSEIYVDVSIYGEIDNGDKYSVPIKSHIEEELEKNGFTLQDDFLKDVLAMEYDCKNRDASSLSCAYEAKLISTGYSQWNDWLTYSLWENTGTVIITKQKADQQIYQHGKTILSEFLYSYRNPE